MTLYQKRHRFSVSDYHRMAEAGILTEYDRVELIEGEIIHRSPIGSKHMAVVNILTKIFSASSNQDHFILSVQNPVGLEDHSEPEPDISLLRFRKDFYATEKPTPRDVLMVAEVADTTLTFDRDRKIPLYAKAGVPESWLVDLVGQRITVFSQPSSEGYRMERHFLPGETIELGSLSEMTMKVSEVFGQF